MHLRRSGGLRILGGRGNSAAKSHDGPGRSYSLVRKAVIFNFGIIFLFVFSGIRLFSDPSHVQRSRGSVVASPAEPTEKTSILPQAPFSPVVAEKIAVEYKTPVAPIILKQNQTLQDALRDARRENIAEFMTCIKQATQTEGETPLVLHTIIDTPIAPYDEARTTWNKAYKAVQYPDIVTFPETTRQVSRIVQCASTTNYFVCARNGKHSYEADTCVHGIVVDMDRFNTFEMLDSQTGRARFGAGQHLGHVAILLQEFNRVMPMGTCPSVGLTGLALVGGHGMLARHHGLLIDFITAVELVDDHGEVIYATADNQYSDYFWLARGGGSGVLHYPGIITAMEFDNLPALETTNEAYTAITFTYEANVENAGRLLKQWQDFYVDPNHLKDPLFRRLMIEPWIKLDRVGLQGLQYKKILELAVYFYGDDKAHGEFMKTYYPKIRSFMKGVQSTIKRYDVLAFARMLSATMNNDELGDGKHGWDLHERGNYRMNHWKGFSAVANSEISEAAFRVIASTVYHSQPLSRRYVEFKALGGAMGEVSQDDTAFWHRKALWWCLSNHFWLSTDDEERVNAIRENARARNMNFVKAIKEANFGGYYAGYIDRTESMVDDLQAYYGEHAERILEIKRSRDAKNLFRIYRPSSVEEVVRAQISSEL